MERQDFDLPFLLRYENVAWYENGIVRILDRRIFPTKVSFVECTTHQEVAKAVADMVTQSAGPYTAIGMGMALAAFECRNETAEKQLTFLKCAAEVLYQSRPTTANRYKLITDNCLLVAEEAMKTDKPVDQAIFNTTIDSLNRRYSTMENVAKQLLLYLPKQCKLLTQCFGETIIGMLCREAKKETREIEFFCAETRPFLQGARLTASCCSEMGFKTTVLTDNMILFGLENLGINAYTSAADTIALDGYIANKIGTKQIAKLVNDFGIPYFVTGIPDADKHSGTDIIIEMRDPQQVKEFQGIKIVVDDVHAIYPSFDITPPNLISGIITDKGFYSPYNLKEYFHSNTSKFY